jgi:hypothetical protein
MRNMALEGWAASGVPRPSPFETRASPAPQGEGYCSGGKFSALSTSPVARLKS